MKKWFQGLDKKVKICLHAVMIFLFFLLPCLSNETNMDVISFLLLVVIIAEIVLIVWSIKPKKKAPDANDNPSSTSNSAFSFGSSTSQPSAPAQTPAPAPKQEIETNIRFDKVVGDYYLRWEYSKVGIAFPDNLDILKLRDCDLTIQAEPDNPHDSGAVALYKGDKKLGYFYRGNIQEMLPKYSQDEDYEVYIFVSLLDKENNKLAVSIAFYHKIDSGNFKRMKASVTKISRKADETGTSRCDNVALQDVGDSVTLESNYEGGYLVCDEYGNELGELSASTSEKVDEIFDDIVFAQIADIEETESGSYKVKLEIYYS